MRCNTRALETELGHSAGWAPRVVLQSIVALTQALGDLKQYPISPAPAPELLPTPRSPASQPEREKFWELLAADESAWIHGECDDLSDRGRAVFDIWNEEGDAAYVWDEFVQSHPDTYEAAVKQLWTFLHRVRRAVGEIVQETDEGIEVLEALADSDWRKWSKVAAPLALAVIAAKTQGLKGTGSEDASTRAQLVAIIAEKENSSEVEVLAANFLPSTDPIPVAPSPISTNLWADDWDFQWQPPGTSEKKPLLTDEFFDCDEHGVPRDGIFDAEAARFCEEPFDMATYQKLALKYEDNCTRVVEPLEYNTWFFSASRNGVGYLVDQFLHGNPIGRPVDSKEEVVVAIKRRLLQYLGPGACQLRMSGLTLQKLSDWRVFADYSAWKALEASIDQHVFDNDPDMLDAARQLKAIHFPEILQLQQDAVTSCRDEAMAQCAAEGIFPDFNPQAQDGYLPHISKNHARFLNLFVEYTKRIMEKRSLNIVNYEFVEPISIS